MRGLSVLLGLLLVVNLTLALRRPRPFRPKPKPKPKPKPAPEPDYDFQVNLRNGKTVGTTDGAISWHVPLSGSAKCRRQGVLKLSFGAPGSADRKEYARIDMWFQNPSAWVFNIGDSVTNNGYGGDSRSTSRDAEIQGLSSTFSIYGNDQAPPPPNRKLIERPNIIQNRLTLIIGNGLVIWNNWGSEFNQLFNTNFLFALNGQSDTEGGAPNYDVYFGLNRVILGGRTGSGLCRAQITWLA